MPTNLANFNSRSKYYLGNVGKVLVTGGEVLTSYYDEETELLYLGGTFTQVNSQSRAGFAVVKTDATLSDIVANINSGTQINTIKKIDGNIYIGGSFTQINGASISYLATISPSGIVSNFGPTLNGAITDLDFRSGNNDIIIAGSFTLANSFPRKKIAIVSLSGSLLDSTISINSDSGYINAVHYNEYLDETFLGGKFEHINGFRSFGAVDLALDEINPDSFRSIIDGGYVYAYHYDGNGFYITGTFTKVKDQTVYGAAYIGNDGIVGSWRPRIEGGYAFNIIVDDVNEIIYVGGTFTQVRSASDPNTISLKSKLAAFDFNGEVLDWTYNADGSVWSMLLDGSTMYVGGSFTNINGIGRNRAAALDASISTSPTVLSWNPNASGDVLTIAKLGGDILIGGNFNTIGGVSRGKFAKVNASTGSIVDQSTFNLNFNAGVAVIKVVDVDGVDEIYVGGSFTAVDGTYFQDGLGTTTFGYTITTKVFRAEANAKPIRFYSLSTTVPTYVWDIAIKKTWSAAMGTTIEAFAAGQPSNMYSAATNAIVQFEPPGASPEQPYIYRNSSLLPAIYKMGYVEDLDMFAVAGVFDLYGASYDLSRARINSNNTRLSFGGGTLITGNRVVKSVDSFGSIIYLAGDFTYASKSGATAVALDISKEGTYSDWSTNWKPRFDNTVDSISVSSDGAKVCVSGDFTSYTPYWTDTYPNSALLRNIGVFSSDSSTIDSSNINLMNSISMSGKNILNVAVPNGFLQVVSIDNTSQLNSVRAWDTRYNVPRN